MKRLSAIITFLALTLSLAIAPASAAPYIPKGFSSDSETQGIVIEDLPDGPDFMSVISNVNAPTPETEADSKLCQSLTTNGCTLDGRKSLTGSSILPNCIESQTNCIEGLKISNADGVMVEAKFVRLVSGFRFNGSPENNIPGGETPSLWIAEGAKNDAGSEKYVVNTSLAWNFNAGKTVIRSMSARVFPVREISGRFEPTRTGSGINARTGLFHTYTHSGEYGENSQCAAVEANYCAERVGFAKGAKVELSLRLTNQLTGWLHGRMQSPQISVTPIDSQNNKLVVDAGAVEVPTFYAEFKRSLMTTTFAEFFNSEYGIGGLNGTAQWYRFGASKAKSRKVIQELATAAKDTASGTVSIWSVKSISAGVNSNACLTDQTKLVGLVTTNAMAYAAEAPAFSGGTLKYEVAGVHYLADGTTLAEGVYDLAIRSEVARCLYGFGKAPIYAEISVTGANGENKVATTKVYESDGWLKLAAYGFTFSSPTISVKLTQASSKKITITCLKGKTVKKVTAVNAKCPVGYKKK